MRAPQTLTRRAATDLPSDHEQDPKEGAASPTPEWDLDSVPDAPAVFLLWPTEGDPYLARTTLLRRRLRRLLVKPDRISRVLRLGSVVDRIEYWLTGSRLEAMLAHLELAQKYFPDAWRKLTRLRPPVFLKLTTQNQFPRTLLTTKLGRGEYFGPFASRAAAERFQTALLDQFQLRRCEENLDPSPQHPGCIYGEMNRCLRPCQQIVSVDEYAHEAQRVSEFLKTDGASLRGAIEAARDRASTAMEFEEAERLHRRLESIDEARGTAGELARRIDRLAGIAVMPSGENDAVELMFLVGGRWCAPIRFRLGQENVQGGAEPVAKTPADGQQTLPLGKNLPPVAASAISAGQSMDARLKALVAEQSVQKPGKPNLEHLSILMRWHGSSWRDGEWISFPSWEKIPYRKIVNAIGRVASGRGRSKPSSEARASEARGTGQQISGSGDAKPEGVKS